MPLTELDTRHIPYDQIEVIFARNRPFNERPPIPRVGDQVFYRREFWDQFPVLVTVIWVQSLLDYTDQNLWTTVRDSYGKAILDGDLPRMAPASDPWPLVRVRGEWSTSDHDAAIVREAETRESRMRGSPGWLPPRWRSRPVRLPEELHRISRPYLPPLNVPLEKPVSDGYCTF